MAPARRWSPLIALLALAVSAGVARAEPPRPQGAVLKNGLQVVVLEDHSSPTVAVVMGYRAGSRNERSGTRGLARLMVALSQDPAFRLETGDRIRALREEVGAQVTGEAGEDFTTFRTVVPREALGAVLALEADRMRPLPFRDTQLRAARVAVRDEDARRQAQEPLTGARGALLAQVFTQHPYGQALGIEDLEQLTLEDCRVFQRAGYAPNNAVLVVVGDVRLAEVQAVAARELGGLPRGTPLPPVAEEPAQKARREVALRDARVPLVGAAWRIPAARGVDSAALELLGAALVSGDGAILKRGLAGGDGAVARQVLGGYAPARDPGAFWILVLAAPNRSARAVEEPLLATLERMRTKGLSAEELERARANVAAGRALARVSLSGRAQELARAELIGVGAASVAAEDQRLKAATAAQVQKAAQAFFAETNLVLGHGGPLAQEGAR